MLLALGPLKLDTAVRAVVVGLTQGPTASCEPSAAGADALWLRSPTPAQVASTVRDVGLPLGVTVDDVDSIAELVECGAVAVECASPGVVGAALELEVTLWCDPSQAAVAIGAGVAPERIVCEPGVGGARTVIGATVFASGPAAWGEVVRAARAGARVVRTTDVRSVRRVVTVLDRLGAAASAEDSFR